MQNFFLYKQFFTKKNLKQNGLQTIVFDQISPTIFYAKKNFSHQKLFSKKKMLHQKISFSQKKFCCLPKHLFDTKKIYSTNKNVH